MGYSLSRMSRMCSSCPKKDECDHKKMELCALAELPQQVSMSVGQSLAMDYQIPLMREPINSPLSPFAYKDELIKEISKSLDINRTIFQSEFRNQLRQMVKMW